MTDGPVPARNDVRGRVAHDHDPRALTDLATLVAAIDSNRPKEAVERLLRRSRERTLTLAERRLNRVQLRLFEWNGLLPRAKTHNQ